jgi:hypothetical protein
VRVHETPDLANAIQAQAFTHGQDIYFNSGKYNPGSSGGKELLAHELTHTMQRNSTRIQLKEDQAKSKTFWEWYNSRIGQEYRSLRDKLESSGYEFHTKVAIGQKGNGSFIWQKGSPEKYTLSTEVAWSVKDPDGKWTWARTHNVVSKCREWLNNSSSNKQTQANNERIRQIEAIVSNSSMPQEELEHLNQERDNLLLASNTFPQIFSNFPEEITASGLPSRNSITLTMLVEEWRRAGLLDPPSRPSDLSEIPPIRSQSNRNSNSGNNVNGSLAGSAALARPLPQANPTAPRWTPRVIPGGGTPNPSPPIGRGLGWLRRLPPWLIPLENLIYPSPTAPAWMDTVSKITSRPYSSPEEYEWETQLTREQIQFLKKTFNEQINQTNGLPNFSTPIKPEEKPEETDEPCSPTGLTPVDPIPMIWYKHPTYYPLSIEIGGHEYERDAPNQQLPFGEPIGVSPQYWPSIGKTFQLIPEGRGPEAARFRAVLTRHGFDWTGLQADHVQDIEWEGPDSFANLWPMDSSANQSAGARQNLHQPIQFCETADGPQRNMRLSQAKASASIYGRWFIISSVQL